MPWPAIYRDVTPLAHSQLWYALDTLQGVKAVDSVVLTARPAVWSRRCCGTISGDAPAIPFRRMCVSPPPLPQRAVSLCERNYRYVPSPCPGVPIPSHEQKCLTVGVTLP